jgi:hypothetical protein
MMKTFLFAAAAGLTLVSATPAPYGPEDAPRGPGAYPLCSRTVHDRCIQPNDRESTAILSADDPAYADGPPPPPPPDYGPPPPPPQMAVRDYPPCSATVRDRCQQGAGYRHVRMARAARPARAMLSAWRHVRRAVERG